MLYLKNKIVTNQDTYGLLKYLSTKMMKSIHNDIPFSLNDSKPVGDGTTRLNNYYTAPKLVEIGCNEFLPDGSDANQPVDEYLFMAGIDSVYHEYQHVMQYREAFHEQTDAGRSLALNHLATAGNFYYYDENYQKMPCEVDAELSGLIGSYNFCSSMFGQPVAERLLCTYVNGRMKNNMYFIPKSCGPFTKADDVFNAMTMMWGKSLHAHRFYFMAGIKAAPSDDAYDYIKSHRMVFDYIRLQPDGYEQDKMLAAIYLNDDCHSNSRAYLQRYFGSVADMDLSCETVLHPPNPGKIIGDWNVNKKTRAEIAHDRFEYLMQKMQETQDKMDEDDDSFGY